MFQGRLKAVHVEKGAHLLELCRYVVLNPVRHWLEVDWVLSQFGNSPPAARRAYASFVREGAHARPWEHLKGGIYFGNDEFIDGLSKKADKNREIPLKQRAPLRPALKEVLKEKDGLRRAYRDHGYRMNEIAAHLGVHYATISRRLTRLESGV